MNSITMPITQKGQVTIPVAVRKLLGLSVKGQVRFVVKDNSVEIQKTSDFASLAGKYPSKKYKGIPDKFYMEKNYKRV